jgi:AraC-like DNA-binding protein
MTRRLQMSLLFVVISLPGFTQVTFVIDHLPQGTPPSDTIYISGTFNDWKMSPEFAFRKRLDGKLAVTLPRGLEEFEYKFSRGTWAKAETDENNSFRPNRRYTGDDEVIEVSILNWQDVGGARSVNVVVFYFFTVAFVFLVTRHFIKKIKTPRRTLVRSLLIFQILISAALLGRVAIEICPPEWVVYLEQAGEMIVVLSCPFWFDIIAAATEGKSLQFMKVVPTGILFLYVILKSFNFTDFTFLNIIFFGTLTWDDLITNLFVLGNLTWYWFRGMNLAKNHETEVNAMKGLLRCMVVLAGVFIFVFTTLAINDVFRSEPRSIEFSQNILPFFGSVFILITSWFIFNREEIFRASVVSALKPEDVQQLKLKIHQAMVSHKFYLNQSLTLNDLADSIGMKPHSLSRAINDGFNQNFRDFVNAYRINEFIQLATLESSKRFTYLGLAFEVGFNSKSTFNAAFKKITQLSPREYFHNLKDNSLAGNELTSTIL